MKADFPRNVFACHDGRVGFSDVEVGPACHLSCTFNGKLAKETAWVDVGECVDSNNVPQGDHGDDDETNFVH
jgi:hypothetical protein